MTALAIDLARLQAMADTHLDAITRDYINGGAGDVPEANVHAWASVRLRPRFLRDVSAIAMSTSVLGVDIATPMMVAPTAFHRLVCAEGELATARAAASEGALYVVSMAATTSLEDIAAAAGDSPRWMQVYCLRDRGATRAVCERARDAGYSAIVVTVDAAVNIANRTFGGARTVNNDLALPNLAPGVERPDISQVVLGYDDTMTFDDLELIKSWTGLPLVVKGVLRADDAMACIAHGADAIAVSNHGGRQLDGCTATMPALAEIAEAVDGRAEVYVDGGLRSGSDIVKALSLGARAVMIGRPILWGLALGGAAGAQGVLRALHAQTQRALGLSGVCDVADVPIDLTTRPAVSVGSKLGVPR